MKKLLYVICFTAFTFGTLYASAAVDFSGTYRSKKCNVFDISTQVTIPELATEIKTSNSFEISQTDDKIVIDGDSNYWNMAPAVYLASTSEGDERIKVKSVKSSDSAITAKYSIVSGSGLIKNTDSYIVTIKKASNGIVHFEMVTHYKNVWTSGFGKQSANIACDFIP